MNRLFASSTLAFRCAALAAAGVVVVAATLHAQAVDFTGWWRFDKAASQVAPGAGLAGLGPGGTPHTLFVQQALNGAITIGSDMNEGQARIYRVNGESQLPAAKGDPIAVKARIDGRTLVAEGAGLKEALALSPDGATLTVTITAGEATSTLIYTKINTVDACTEWPTPCRN
jgi:hypothetical protein